MSDQPSTVGIATNIVDTWKLKHPSAMIMLPEAFFPAIGHVVTSWGFFESLFENFLAALVMANGTAKENWRSESFPKRRKLFAAEARRAFEGFPAIIGYLESILNDSIPIQQKRNLVTHGRLSAQISSVESQVKLICVGFHKGQERREDFNREELDDLHYEIVHLAGRLHCAPEAPLFSSSDKSKLLDFLKSYHPTFPNPVMPPPQPRSS